MDPDSGRYDVADPDSGGTMLRIRIQGDMLLRILMTIYVKSSIPIYKCLGE